MDFSQGRIDFSNRAWLSRQTGSISSVTRKSVPLKISNYSHSFCAQGPWSSPLFHSLLPSPPLCDLVPRSLLTPPFLTFPC